MTLASLLISAAALFLSLIVACLTLWRRGALRITRPVQVGFLYEHEQPKVFLRAMLYATGKRGHIIEALYLKVRRGESTQTFNFWVYGESAPLMIGSGLRVGEDGVSFNHHFLPPGEAPFEFLAGEYVIDVYAQIISRHSIVRLSTVKLSLTDGLAAALHDPSTGWCNSFGIQIRRAMKAMCFHSRPRDAHARFLVQAENFLGHDKTSTASGTQYPAIPDLQKLSSYLFQLLTPFIAPLSAPPGPTT